MVRHWAHFAIALTALLFVGGFQPLPAQSSGYIDPATAKLAGLSEDVALLRQEVRNLQLEVERITRENIQLRQAIQRSTTSQQNSSAQLKAVENKLRGEWTAALANQQRQTIREIAGLLGELRRELERPATVATPTPSIPAESEEVEVVFTDDYPKEGIAYIVQPGDSLSKIAQMHNSSVRDIQNANRLVDPNRLQVGQKLFIPQRNP